MKMKLIYSFLTFFFFVLFFSCQQELHFDIGNASGSLKKDSNGDCLPIVVGGTYFAGKSLGDTNYIEVEVNITSPGTYAIRTDTVNGYSFKGTGSFSTAGSRRIKLAGSGNPITQGSNSFTVIYDTSLCHAEVNVLPAGGAGGPAVFTLQGAPTTCMNAAIKGSYVKGIAVDTGSKINIGINVTTPGTYTISTNTVNGYSFSGSGIFSLTGLQTISLTASGVPVNSGTNVFTVTAGASACTFSVTVLTAIVITNNDHFPLTSNSHWTYDELFHPGDSLKRKITDTVTLSGNMYKIMDEQPMSGGPFQYFYRKTGSDYFEYGAVDKYTNSVQYASTVNGLIPFLKENLSTGDSWQSAEFSDTASFGQVILLRYQFSCMDANATVTINGNAFINVYKMVMKPQIASVSNPYGYTGEIYTYYYAKGVGIVYAKKTRDGFTLSELALRSWLVN
jgi:hypothetical protein